MNCLIHYFGYWVKFSRARCTFSWLQEKRNITPTNRGRSSLQARGSSEAAEWKGIHWECAIYMPRHRWIQLSHVRLQNFSSFNCVCKYTHRDIFFLKSWLKGYWTLKKKKRQKNYVKKHSVDFQENKIPLLPLLPSSKYLLKAICKTQLLHR